MFSQEDFDFDFDFDFDETASSDLLDREQVAELRQLFDVFVEEPGYFSSITSAKLKNVFDKMQLGVSLLQCEAIINQHINLSPKEGELTFEDFLLLYSKANTHLTHADEMKAVFSLLDENNDGFVEIPKLRAIFGGLLGSEASARNLLRTAYPEEQNLQTESKELPSCLRDSSTRCLFVCLFVNMFVCMLLFFHPIHLRTRMTPAAPELVSLDL